MHACNNSVNLENATLLLTLTEYFPRSLILVALIYVQHFVFYDSIVEFLEIIGPLANKAWNI